MKYTLYLTDKDPANNMTIECSTGQEAAKYKNKALEQGYKVEVKGEKHDERATNRVQRPTARN